MDHHKVETFQALVDRASELLTRAERFPRENAIAEAMLIMELLRQHYDGPLSKDEIAFLANSDAQSTLWTGCGDMERL